MSLMTNDNGLASGIIKGLNPHHGRRLDRDILRGRRQTWTQTYDVVEKGHLHLTGFTTEQFWLETFQSA